MKFIPRADAAQPEPEPAGVGGGLGLPPSGAAPVGLPTPTRSSSANASGLGAVPAIPAPVRLPVPSTQPEPEPELPMEAQRSSHRRASDGRGDGRSAPAAAAAAPAPPTPAPAPATTTSKTASLLKVVAVLVVILAAVIAGIGDAGPVLQDSLGVEMAGGNMLKVVKKGAPLPATVSHNFSTTRDNQTSILLKLFEGEKEKTKYCQPVLELEFGGISPRPAKQNAPAIEFEFMVDKKQRVSVTASDRTRGGTSLQVISTKYFLAGGRGGGAAGYIGMCSDAT